MALIEWNDGFVLGIAEIDKQHHSLIDMINEVNQAMAQGKGREIVMQLIQSMVIYSQTHFKLEEMYFKQFGYCDTDEHISEHAKFSKKIRGFQEAYLDGNTNVTIQILEFASNWIRFHILGTDKKYTDLFHANGLK